MRRASLIAKGRARGHRPTDGLESFAFGATEGGDGHDARKVGDEGHVVNNHRGKLALSGITDLETWDYLSKLLGEQDVDRVSVTDQSGGGHSTSRSQQREPLALADVLRQLPLGSGVLVYGSRPPARVRFRLSNNSSLAGARC